MTAILLFLPELSSQLSPRRRLGELNEGQLFGEMAYLLNETRTASVVADGEITVLALPPHLLEELMRHSAPLSRRIIDTLCQRLERMNLAPPHTSHAPGLQVESAD